MRHHTDLKRNASPYIFIERKKCRACWKCLDVCRQGVIGRINMPFHQHARILNPDLCRGCGMCVKVCEFQAIVAIPLNKDIAD